MSDLYVCIRSSYLGVRLAHPRFVSELLLWSVRMKTIETLTHEILPGVDPMGDAFGIPAEVPAVRAVHPDYLRFGF